MISLYLRAPDHDALIEALPFLAFDDDGAVGDTDRYAMDLIGPVIVSDAVIGGDGETVVTPAVMDDRYHANLRLLDESLAAQVPDRLIVTPARPMREWA
ncbi:MAG: hypothetical protein M9932_04630 [Xanthobacteraceae bacterium]|nr:hypothetical protein [Xanthobacteraceae bacterium]